MPKFRTKEQNRRFWAIANQLGLTDDDRAEYALSYSNNRTESTSKLYVNEFEALNNHLDSLLNGQSTPRRTVNYNRQKFGNFEEFIHQEQRDKITKLCLEGNISDERLAGISKRACTHAYPLTVKHGQKVIEALKNIVRREKPTKVKTKKEAA